MHILATLPAHGGNRVTHDAIFCLRSLVSARTSNRRDPRSMQNSRSCAELASTKDMEKSSDRVANIDRDTSEIVRIAYLQSREISGSADTGDASDKSESSAARKNNCIGRLAELPIVASVNTRITQTYTSLKESNSTVERIIEKTEKTLAEGARFVAPVTSAIGETLEEPLKVIDGVVCNGIDYLETNVPSVNLPPGEMYDKLENYVRDISASARTRSAELITDAQLTLEKLKKIVQTEEKEEPADVITDPPPKSDDNC